MSSIKIELPSIKHLKYQLIRGIRRIFIDRYSFADTMLWVLVAVMVGSFKFESLLFTGLAIIVGVAITSSISGLIQGLLKTRKLNGWSKSNEIDVYPFHDPKN